MRTNQLLICGIIAAFSAMISSCDTASHRLPIYGKKTPYHTTVNGKDVVDTAYQQIPDFRFLNQDSTPVTNKFFDGKVYVADFFFTKCPSICPIMHRNLIGIYRQYEGNPSVRFLSHSVDFRNDKPSVLKKYAAKLGVAGNQWQFLTGPKEQIYQLAENSYVSAAQEMPDAPGGFAHSGYLLLIDQQRRLRGAYDGTDSLAVQQLSYDIQLLLQENQSTEH